MEIGVRWRCLWKKFLQPELHSHAVLHSIFVCDKDEERIGYDEHELDDMIQKWQPSTLSLSDTFAVSQFFACADTFG